MTGTIPPLRFIEGDRMRFERIAAELARLRDEAADLGADFLAYLIASAQREASQVATGKQLP